jgi:hypothetical protein
MICNPNALEDAQSFVKGEFTYDLERRFVSLQLVVLLIGAPPTVPADL